MRYVVLIIGWVLTSASLGAIGAVLFGRVPAASVLISFPVLLAGLGLLLQREWCRLLAVWLARLAVLLLLALVGLWSSKGPLASAQRQTVSGSLVLAVLLWYLLSQPRVRVQFGTLAERWRTNVILNRWLGLLHLLCVPVGFIAAHICVNFGLRVLDEPPGGAAGSLLGPFLSIGLSVVAFLVAAVLTWATIGSLLRGIRLLRSR